MTPDIKLKGGKKLAATLKLLDLKTERKFGMQALRAGARVIIKDARKRVPVKTGLLRRRGFITKAAKGRRNEIVLTLGTRGGKNAPWYAHLIEFGTKPRTIKARKAVLVNPESGQVFGKTVEHPGTRAKPFFRPALDENKTEVLEAIGKKLFDLLEKEAR